AESPTMNPSLSLPRFAALPLALVSVALAGCPDVTEYPGDGGSVKPSDPAKQPGPVGKLKLVQTMVQSDDALVTSMSNFVVSPSDEKIYATSWDGRVITFDRSPADGSLGRMYTTPLYNSTGLEITADGKHLYAVGANSPDQILRLDVDLATGEP